MHKKHRFPPAICYVFVIYGTFFIMNLDFRLKNAIM